MRACCLVGRHLPPWTFSAALCCAVLSIRSRICEDVQASKCYETRSRLPHEPVLRTRTALRSGDAALCPFSVTRRGRARARGAGEANRVFGRRAYGCGPVIGWRDGRVSGDRTVDHVHVTKMFVSSDGSAKSRRVLLRGVRGSGRVGLLLGADVVEVMKENRRCLIP
jgi:hypothetical protein